MPSASVVRPEFEPTLPQLVARRTGMGERRARIALLVAIALLALVILAARRATAHETRYIRRDSPRFNFSYDDVQLARVGGARGSRGAYVQLERGGRGTARASFTVLPLRIPAYRGDVNGVLPVFATTVLQPAYARRYDGFDLVEEGRARVNDVAGYTFAFRSRPGGGRAVYGRIVLLPEPGDHPRHGVVLRMLSTRSRQVSNASRVGATGVLQEPYRSFRFGTEQP